MMEIHIDTNIYSAAMVGDPRSVDVLQSASNIYVSSVVIGELLSGFKVGDKEASNRQQLNEFLDSPRVQIAKIGERTTEHYSNVFNELRKSGKVIPPNDMWIAASALEHGMPLATMDQHFEAVPGLILVP